MNVISALVLSLASAQGLSTTAPVPETLDSRWIPGIGTVQLSTRGGPRLTLEIRDANGRTTTRNLELDRLAADAVVVEARASSFIDHEGLAIGLAARTGDTTSYHSLLLRKLSDQTAEARTNVQGEPGRAYWSLTEPIFTSTGDRYRILDVHNPGGDTLEITFRRGYVDAERGEPRLDEKIYVNICPGVEAFVAGWLLNTSATRVPR